MFVFLMEALSHITSSEIHSTDRVKNLRVESLFFFFIIEVFLFGSFWMSWSSVDFFVILLHEYLLPDLLQVDKLQVLNPYHLRV